eukprot:CAMPEP_0171226622 /NCGR_PEP_ID=MMETSP0790-20130122/37425_1 /TAXON_ID=2925 /ORGANISM="Alexandrium catenella, Strain OF101" /LENGTH=51 /DNA_ID=CAMNT_0011692707 /DNA_START=48 /DNA_END=201 /DNA_ORIENTATION=-
MTARAPLQVHAPDDGDEGRGEVEHVDVEGHADQAVRRGVDHDGVEGAHEVV